LKVKNIYVIRHGETDWNKDNRFQGQSDIPLNAKGLEQAVALAPLMSQLQIDSVYSSSLSRAYKTAEIAVQDLKLSIQKDDRLKETQLGQVEGLTMDEIIALVGSDAIAKWRSYEERLLDFRFPEGESKRQMMYRCRAALLEIAQNSSRNNIAVFAHGMMMRALTYVFGSGIAWDHHAFSNGSVHHFLWSDEQSEFMIYKGKIN
jgi:broad specificity phosphatase PhoE